MDKNKETFDTWNNIASLYQDKFMDLDVYNESYDLICSDVNKLGAQILEIGCGPGNIARYLLSKRPDFDLLGIDIAPAMIELARQNNPTARFEVRDTREIRQLNVCFDGIVGGFCLPYLSSSECKQLLVDAFDLLNDQGLLYLSFVEGDPSTSDYKVGSGGRVFFNYHRLDVLKKDLVDIGFREIRTMEVNYRTSETTFDIHTILTAKKSQDEK